MSSLRKRWRRLRYGDPIVVISGLPRSGTSMAMRMVEAGGLEIVSDGQRAADEDNPRGYYEDKRVKDLARSDDKSWLRAARGKAIKIISSLLRELPVSHNYLVVLMRRDVSEVLASQAKMLDRRAEQHEVNDDQMRELWESDIWRARYLLEHQSHFDFIEVLYTDVLEDPQREARRMGDFLGGALDVGAMVGAVDSSLYRNRAS